MTLQKAVYAIVLYNDHEKPIEIHTEKCSFLSILSYAQKDKQNPDFTYGMITGLLTEAIKQAQDTAIEKKYPKGWIKAGCCFNTT